jgi:hypothetical protein
MCTDLHPALMSSAPSDEGAARGDRQENTGLHIDTAPTSGRSSCIPVSKSHLRSEGLMYWETGNAYNPI